MQQIFSADGASAGEENVKPLIRFPLPLDVPRKRARSPASVTNDTAAPHLTPEEHRALCRFIEYGNQVAPASAVFAHSAGPQRGTPAQLFAAAQPPSSATAVQHRWCFRALYQARSLLCRFLELDSAGHFLRPTPASLNASSSTPAASTEAAASASSAAESLLPSPPSCVSTLELYCRFQALELELEDATLRVESAAQAEAVPAAVRQQARADVDAAVRCIERSVDALEGTLVHMLLLDSATPEGQPTSSTRVPSAAPAAPPLEYMAKMLRELPAVLQSEQWPAQFVCDRGSAVATAAESPSASTAADASPVARIFAEGDNANTASSLATELGGATTSLALRSLFDLCDADVFNLLDTAAASPVSRLAALAKMSAAGTAAPHNGARLPVDAESAQFKTILVQAWNQGYATVGLRRLAFEMEVLFYQHTTRAQQLKPRHGSGATARDVRELRSTWWRALESRTSALLSKVGEAPEKTPLAAALGIFDTTVESCAVMRQHAVPAAALADVQTTAIRVLTRLQAVDTKGWFAVPAFDLVNVDFTSMRYWIASPSFGRKSKREAYRSLCRVLERMVDCCVQKYGPTHAFSDVIATVRQQLVDVARAEGLL